MKISLCLNGFFFFSAKVCDIKTKGIKVPLYIILLFFGLIVCTNFLSLLIDSLFGGKERNFFDILRWHATLQEPAGEEFSLPRIMRIALI